MLKRYAVLVWILSVFVLDRGTKILAEYFLDYHEVMPIIPGLNLTLAYNRGAAFSFLANAGGWQQIFFIALGLIMSVVLTVFIRKTPKTKKAERLGLILILSGAIGNLYDRIRFAHVVDFIDIYYQELHWPAFNIADSAICIGALMFLVSGLLNKK